jgi:tagatose 6-phosphate kinase
MILCVGPTPALQRVMVFQRLTLDAVNRAAETQEGIAGKSVNVAKVLKTLGQKPLAMGFAGGDHGKELRAGLEARGIETEFLEVRARTRQCITVIDESSETQTELVEESSAVEAADYDALLEAIRRRIKGCQAVVMSGTLTPGGPVDFYFHCTKIAREEGVVSVVDAQGPAFLAALQAGPDVVKPNRAELAATVGRELKDESDVIEAMRGLLEGGAKRIVVTAGKAPALAGDGKSFWRITPPLIKALNPIGSGDAFTAGLVSRLLRGDGLDEACRWGSACGAANALTLMAGEVSLAEVQKLGGKVGVEKLHGM